MKVVDVVGVQKHLLFQGRKKKRRGGQKYILKGVAGCQRRLLDDELFLCWLRLLPHWRERERVRYINFRLYQQKKSFLVRISQAAKSDCLRDVTWDSFSDPRVSPWLPNDGRSRPGNLTDARLLISVSIFGRRREMTIRRRGESEEVDGPLPTTSGILSIHRERERAQQLRLFVSLSLSPSLSIDRSESIRQCVSTRRLIYRLVAFHPQNE